MKKSIPKQGKRRKKAHERTRVLHRGVHIEMSSAIVMSIGSKDEYDDLCIMYLIHVIGCLTISAYHLH